MGSAQSHHTNTHPDTDGSFQSDHSQSVRQNNSKQPSPRRDVIPSRNDVIQDTQQRQQSKSDGRSTNVGHDNLTLLSSTRHEGGGDPTILEYVANSVVGKDLILSGPFGQRKVLYLDYIASGRPLTFIEEYITKEVLPLYANTHTTTSYTARQTTTFRNDARNIIRRATNASDDDAVIFTGNGVTGAIHKLIHGLSLKDPPVVLIGPYEHHSNILPWREIGADVFGINQTSLGLVDLLHLEEELQRWSNSGRRMIASMSAASNVTGILSDVDAITVLLHKYGALAFWDYATAAPYVDLNMNPAHSGKESTLAYKDAMLVSPHKFVGGVSTPGLLIVKKKLLTNQVPHDCGGGTVIVVRQTGHRYLQDVEEREEGGTPAIVGAIRAGLTFQLKAAITPRLIMQREQTLFRQAREAWRSVPNLMILGNLDVDRLPIFSFLVHHPATGYYLHYNYVACLLNDLFGIQARGGCACAGPYAMDLLGISEEQAIEIEELLTREKKTDTNKNPRDFGDAMREIFKPGFTRLNLPFFISEDQLNFVLQAVAMIAEDGWKLLPQYKFNPRTGEWKHQNSQESKQQRRLDHLSYDKGYLECHLPKPVPGGGTHPETLQLCLDTARTLFVEAEQKIETMTDQSHLFDDFARSSRWFLLPSEANKVLRAFSTVRSLGPAKVFISPKKTQLKQFAGFADSSSQSGSSRSRTTTTSLGEAESGNDSPRTVSNSKNGKRRVKAAGSVKIKVQGYKQGPKQHEERKWQH